MKRKLNFSISIDLKDIIVTSRESKENTINPN